MKFGPVPLDQALGAVLAHSARAAEPPYDGGRSYRIAKGTRLGPQHIADLRAEGVGMITVARLDPGDVDENAAALALARALVPEPAAQGLHLAAAGAGRVNLVADHAGIVALDAARLAALNLVDPMITVATLAPFARVAAEAMVATIKIIAYAVPQAALAAACAQACAPAGGAIRLCPPVYASASLIETAIGRDTPPDKGRRVTQARLARFGLALTDRVVVAHDAGAIATALRAAPGEVLLILTASATSDARDTAPEGLRAAGGRLIRFGMPVDPGNLLFLGMLDQKPVIGLPGCARSPAMNGADWVLERVICGLDITAQDIAAMGVGGLLKEIPTRPRPRRASPVAGSPDEN